MKSIRIRPRYYRLYTDPGVELAEENYRHRELDWQVPIGEAALVCLDCWNCHFSLDTLERIEQISNETIPPVLAACREAGVLVIHAPAGTVAEKSANWVRLIGGDETRQRAWPESPDWPPAMFRQKTGAYAAYAQPHEPQLAEREHMREEERDFHPAVRPVGDEPVVASGEELHRLCAQRGILHLIYVGFNTNACIVRRDYGTYAMLDRGYSVILLSDCTTGMETHETKADLACTRGTIASLEQFGIYTMTGSELIDALQ